MARPIEGRIVITLGSDPVTDVVVTNIDEIRELFQKRILEVPFRYEPIGDEDD